MDWYSWLSRSSLEPSLVYEYGLAFARNELEKEDLSHFNHEFLQSMGISVAKHRLEIIKLARKEVGGSRSSIWKFITAISKTKKCFTGTISRKVFNKDSTRITVQELTPYRTQWSGALRKQNSAKDCKQEKVTATNTRAMRSGPLDRRVQEKLMVTTSRSFSSVSGPLDGKKDENNNNVVFTYRRSPNKSGPLDGYGRALSPKVNHHHYGNDNLHANSDGVVPSLWSLMFQDLKPT
ncbi:uncharacterized protein LOC132280018 [Cornus florida]|uniref:uncharacterized protein LOC132280018 n=1 Tax=Cornus florida TaxID=4283 RepID=UPI0028A1220D|nr:uncharacterized protein LOC132280018 [Cornus florida]